MVGERLSKNFGCHGWADDKKIFKKNWLKRPKAVAKNKIWTKI